jgi:hypothetical protein
MTFSSPSPSALGIQPSKINIIYSVHLTSVGALTASMISSPIFIHFLPRSAYSSILKIEAAGTFETIVTVYQITGCHIPENYILRTQCHENLIFDIFFFFCLCDLVVRVSGCRSRGPGFDFRPYQIFCEVGDLERGPLSLVRTIEELL